MKIIAIFNIIIAIVTTGKTTTTTTRNTRLEQRHCKWSPVINRKMFAGPSEKKKIPLSGHVLKL